MGLNEFEWAAGVIRDLKSKGKRSGPDFEAMERAELKYHIIQSVALNEIKEMINTRKGGQVLSEAELHELIADIETVAGFASRVDLTNPHYDGYAIVEAMKFDPSIDVLTQAKRA